MSSQLCPIIGLTHDQLAFVIAALDRDHRRRGRPWSASLRDRVIITCASLRTNLTLRELAAVFSISKSQVHRIIADLTPRPRTAAASGSRRPQGARVDGRPLAECSEYEPLQQLTRHLHKLRLSGAALARVLAQLVAVCMVGNDPEGLTAILPLVPDEVTWDILAFNLACTYARENDRAAMLRFTKRALELGKSPDQFLCDGDFEDFVDDREFVAILDAHR